MSDVGYAYVVTDVTREHPTELSIPDAVQPPFKVGDLVLREEPDLEILVDEDGPITTTATLHRVARGPMVDGSVKFSPAALTALELLARGQNFTVLVAMEKQMLIHKVNETIEEWGDLRKIDSKDLRGRVSRL